MALRWIPLLDENGDILLDENGDPILVLGEATSSEGASGGKAKREQPKPDPRLWQIYQEEAARLWKPKPKPVEPEPEPEPELPEPEPYFDPEAEAEAERRRVEAERLRKERNKQAISQLLRKAARRS